MTTLGTILTIDVDPETNQGIDQAAAIVTAVYSDNSLRIRVLGDNAADDSVRNYVGEDGQPFEQPAPAPAPATTTPLASSSTTAAPSESDVAGMVEALSPADRAALIAALTGGQNTDQSQTATPPTADATPNTTAL